MGSDILLTTQFMYLMIICSGLSLILLLLPFLLYGKAIFSGDHTRNGIIEEVLKVFVFHFLAVFFAILVTAFVDITIAKPSLKPSYALEQFYMVNGNTNAFWEGWLNADLTSAASGNKKDIELISRLSTFMKFYMLAFVLVFILIPGGLLIFGIKSLVSFGQTGQMGQQETGGDVLRRLGGGLLLTAGASMLVWVHLLFASAYVSTVIHAGSFSFFNLINIFWYKIIFG